MKKISALILMLCMLVSLTGCTQVQNDLLADMNKVNDWEASTISQKGTVIVSAADQKQQINIESEGYVNNKTFQGYITTKVTDPTQQQTIPSMEMYIDQGKTYINKSYFEQIYTTSGMPIPKNLQKITADYIGIESMNQDMMTMIGNMSTSEMGAKSIEFYEKLGKELNLNFDVTKSDNTYTISLDGKDFEQILTQLTAENKLNRCFEIMKETMGLDLTAFVDEVPQITKEDLTEVVAALQPAKLQIKYTIANSEFTQEIDMSYDSPEMAMNMNLVSINKKADAKQVVLPTNRIDLTMEEYQNLLTTKTAIVQLNEGILMGTTNYTPTNITIVKENNETYLPIRALMETLEYEVRYDDKQKSVTLVNEDITIPVNVVIKDSTSYVGLKELVKHQFTVNTLDENTLMIME